MNYKIVNGSILYGAETILEEINFEIKDKDKIAIVGRNGAGKTTFLKALIDNDMLEEGIGEEKFGVYKMGSFKIGYLKQINFENSNKTMLEEILEAYEPILELERRLKKKEKEVQENPTEKVIKEYTSVLEEFKFQDGYSYQKEYELAIKKFGFKEEDKYKNIQEFSGGQQIKIAFLKLLLSKPDILLLDEPTNHLDIFAIEWLEEYLKEYSKAVVIVSHDRMFLDKIVNKVYEIEYATMIEYKGNYSQFVEQKKQNYEKQLKDYEYQQAEIKRLQAIADRFRYKPTKAKMALSKLKKIEQMVIIDKPNKADDKSFAKKFELKSESGKNVLKVKDLEFGYDNPIGKTSFELYRGQKLAVIGENGTGKSTFLKTLNNSIPKLSGEFEFGYNVQTGYYDQQMEFENPKNTILEEMQSACTNMTVTEIRTLLGTFLFSGEEVFKEISILSGGEKARLQLCKLLTKGANLLLLDEPTNHIDIIGKEVIENILKEYKGTIIFISHDRYFISQIADCILEFEDKKVKFYDKNFIEYMEYKKNNKFDNTEKEKVVKKESKSLNNPYFLDKEKNRIKNQIEKIEKQIEEKEAKIEQIKEDMLKDENSSDYVKLNELQTNIENIGKEIEEKMLEWEQLNDNYNNLI